MYLFLLKCWCLILNHFVFFKLTCPLVIYFTYETFNLMIKLIKNICTCVKIRIAMWMQRQIESIIWKKNPPKNLMNSGTTNQISRRVLGRINLLYNFLVYLDHVATNSPESIYMYLHFSKKKICLLRVTNYHFFLAQSPLSLSDDRVNKRTEDLKDELILISVLC